MLHRSIKLYILSFTLLFSVLLASCSEAKPKVENKSISNSETKVDKPQPSKDEKASENNIQAKDAGTNNNTAINPVKYPDVDAETIKIPVLMYHSINEKSTNNLIIKPNEFEAEMNWLKQQDYTPLSLEEFYQIITTGKNCPPKPVAITFDDGYKDNYDNAYPVLKKYGFKATIFVITKYIGQPDYLTEDNIKEMFQNNIDFQSHTDTHNELNSMSYAEQLKELTTSRDKLNALLGKSTEFLCYPSGKYNNDTIKADTAAGYKMSFTTKSGFANKSWGLETIPRIRMYPGFNMSAIQANTK